MSSSAASSSSSPPLTPPSPLPVSVGPGRRPYAFTPSPSASPPFSPRDFDASPSPSPLLARRAVRSEPRLLHYSAFSMDAAASARREQPPGRRFDLGAWCFEWVLLLVRCCCCCSWRPASRQQLS
ncbi:hypothetical protein D1007_22700 [Hordeum vulgare]|uniref:uncharacterized protein LOC123397982 n=1 Tax=Hordeum vulgare subsp. vulgare TaxID=112509 RepID=UPI001D1A5164|nr:uncharacterized protein LOC123397982 [Hordeum vulgare subsp. vulgare]KAE8801668.1 hypothetical protein D1007_22700 [Hordeum vulgare]KAI4989025.1 hypothetical protein ZWY2020_036342 [Hordeum vulgare]